jgi:hypothetical protein
LPIVSWFVVFDEARWGRILCFMRLTVSIVLSLAVFQARLLAQSSTPSSDGMPQLRVCCRPLPKWSSSRNPFLFALHKTIVTHLHHCYIDLGDQAILPEIGSSVQTSGIHPIVSDNDNKQPIPDQVTDSLTEGGGCRKVEEVTPEKLRRLHEELAGGTCNSCASRYHNRVMGLCFNNSNTYVFDLISGAGLKPPKMRGAPGYRGHHACVGSEKGRRK